MSPGARPARGWLSFRRIVDIPFATCVAALESWQLTGQHGGRHAGQPLVCGPAEHDRDRGTCRIQVRLARGPLRPPLRMRLEADHWSSCPPRTALELIPCGRVRPSAAHFRAGHLLLDRLTGALAQPTPARRPGRVLASPPHADQGKPGPGVALPVRRPGRTAAAASTHRTTGA
jgi:hypothetical protein